MKNGAKTKNGKQVIVWSRPKIDPENYSEIHLPCGQCKGCRLDYSREWAQRIMREKKTSEYSYFLTLTYDDEKIPKRISLDEKIESTTLIKEDLQNFWKRLRNHMKVRYYACGEYGEETHRRHYHAIIFTEEPINDLEPFFISKDHNQVYRSEFIKRVWGNGHIAIGEVSWESRRYVARYIMKKQKGENAAIYDYLNITPEFVQMSLKPAIGSKYYELYKDKIYQNDEVITLNKGKAIPLKPARYYDKLYDLEHPEQLEKIKKNRQRARIENRKLTLSRTTLDEEEYLLNKEEAFENKIKRLHRNKDFNAIEI